MLCLASLVTPVALAQVAPQSVPAYVPAAARLARPISTMVSNDRLSFAITLPLRNREALTNLLREITEPSSPNFRHYLTREEFTARFGPTEHDYNAVKAFATAHGLRINAEHGNRIVLELSGTVADIERALHTTIGVYQHPTESRTFYAPTTEPTLDLAVPVLSVRGLDNYALARPHLQTQALVAGQNADPNSGSGPANAYGGNDFRAVYAADTTLTGDGQVVGLLQFDGYTASDIAYYETYFGLPSVTLSNVLLNGASGHPSGSGGEVEVSLDIETAISMAPGLSQVMVYMAPNPTPFEVILNRMVSDNAARQLSCSWYMPHGTKNPTTDQIFQEMAAQGQTFFNASGDYDAYTGLIDFPGDTPYITQVGGTMLSTTAPGGARASEAVWNRGNGIGSGGGISTQYPIPDWQTNIDMTANQGSTTMRNTPDVALTAENVYVRVNSQDYRVGGTSCAAPLWAGFAALINEEATLSTQPPIGFINPALDTICSGPGYSACFYDITVGDNTSPSSPSKFYATPGYDLGTGWGVPNGQSLIMALANPEPLLISPASGFSSTGGVGGPFTVTSQTLTLTNAGTNTLTWTVANPSPWLTVSPTGGTLLPSNAPTLATVSLNSAASNLVVGTYTASIWFTNLNDDQSIERDYVLSVISPPSIVTQPTDQNVLDGAPATFTVQADGGLPMFYQWQLNNTNLADNDHITGSATTNLVVNNASSADVGPYLVVITNLAGAVTSSVAQLTLSNSAPVITIPPASQTVIAGRPVTFTVSAVGNKPFFYQWSYGGISGTNIDGATNASFTIPSTQLSDSGLYAVTMSNSVGATRSPDATLNVVLVPVILSFTPTSAAVGTNVSITGLNFSAEPSSNVVYFGAVQAVVTSASPTNLIATVPSGATFAPITETVNGLTAFAPQPFLPVFPGMGRIDASSLGTPVDLSAPNGPSRTAIADLNGDGKPDLIVASALDGHVWIYQNISTNTGGPITTDTFALPVVLAANTNGSSLYSVATADLDCDGQLDIIVIDANNNLVSIYRNLGPGQTITGGSFADPVNLAAGNVMRGLAISDVNHDGKPDIATANWGDNTISLFENQSNPGNISFADRVDFAAAQGVFSIVIADVDDDGNPDLVTANNANSTTAVSIVQNPGIYGTISTNSFMSRIDLSGNSAPESLAVGDVDGDGKLDIVVASPAGQTVSVYRNVNVAGIINTNSFGQAVDFASGGVVNSVSLADIDGDGRLDVVSASQGSDIVSAFKNVSTVGTFDTNSLAQRVDFPTSSNPQGIAVGDLNGDGRPEIALVNFYANRLSIYQNSSALNGAPTITSQPTNTTVFVSSNATFVVSASGDSPLFYDWYFNQTNLVQEGTNSTFIITNAQFSDAGIYSVTVSNNLGSATSSNALLLVNPLPSTIPIIMSFLPTSARPGNTITLGGSNFSATASNNIVYFGAVRALVTSATVTNLTVVVPTGATFARITLIVGGLEAVANQPFVPSFPGAGRFDSSSLSGRTDFTTAPGPVQTAIADLDGDGKSDLIIGDATSGTISIFRNISTNGTLNAGSFAPRFDLSMGASGSADPYAITIADIDGDGKLDIIAINADSNIVSIFRNISQPGTLSAGSFAARIDLSGGHVMRGIAVGDLDDDGKLDIAVSNTGDSTVSVFQNQSTPGDISFATRVNYATAAGTFGVGIADVDGDGKRDIITVNNGAGAAGTVSVLRNITPASVIATNSFAPHVDFRGGASAESLAIGDIDRDGKLDLVVGSPAGHAVLVYQNTSTPGIINTNSFASEVTFACPGIVNFVALADMDGDGKIDIATVSQSSSWLSFFKNLSTPGTFTTGSLAARVDFATGSNANGVSLGDLDGDGQPDVVFNDFGNNSMSIYRNTASNGIPPFITSQPTNFVASIGGTATFSITASGTGPLQFQWYQNQTNHIIAGTNSTLILSNVQPADAGLYDVTVSSIFGSTTSSNALLILTGFSHFSWTAIPSPRFANAPFAVTVTAQDITNAVFTNFTDTVMLSSTNGVAVSPQVSGNFSGGVWSGTITVAQPVAGLVLRADDGAGHTGLSGAIDIVNPPSLGALNFGTSLMMTWPVSSSNFLLESSDDLSPGSWTAVSGSPLSFNGENLQSVPVTSTNQFFRLRFMGP